MFVKHKALENPDFFNPFRSWLEGLSRALCKGQEPKPDHTVDAYISDLMLCNETTWLALACVITAQAPAIERLARAHGRIVPACMIDAKNPRERLMRSLIRLGSPAESEKALVRATKLVQGFRTIFAPQGSQKDAA